MTEELAKKRIKQIYTDDVSDSNFLYFDTVNMSVCLLVVGVMQNNKVTCDRYRVDFSVDSVFKPISFQPQLLSWVELGEELINQDCILIDTESAFFDELTDLIDDGDIEDSKSHKKNYYLRRIYELIDSEIGLPDKMDDYCIENWYYEWYGDEKGRQRIVSSKLNH